SACDRLAGFIASRDIETEIVCERDKGLTMLRDNLYEGVVFVLDVSDPQLVEWICDIDRLNDHYPIALIICAPEMLGELAMSQPVSGRRRSPGFADNTRILLGPERSAP